MVGLWPRAVSLLTVQYRMNEEIMAFPSRWFYHNRLQAAPEAADRLVSPLDTPLMWLDTSGHTPQSLRDSSPILGEQPRGGGFAASASSSPKVGEGDRREAVVEEYAERRTKTGSISNSQEARLVIHTLRDYIEMVSPQKIESERVDFGVITPYRGQARLIRRLLKMQHYFRKLKRHITVGTVDGFQGQERDVIVISLVRDNAEGSIGFLRDLRRMNVAMTRARMKLIIVGNAETLGRHRFYRALIEHIKEHGEFVAVQPTES